MTDTTKTMPKPANKSADKEAQYQRVDKGFDYPGKLISTIDFRKLGVIHPSGRIKEMNERHGYNIAKVDLQWGRWAVSSSLSVQPFLLWRTRKR